MRDRAGESEQRAVAAKEWQSVGERDEGLLHHVVSLGRLGAERTRNEAADARGITIEELMRRVFITGFEAGDEIRFRRSRRLFGSHERDSPPGLHLPFFR